MSYRGTENTQKDKSVTTMAANENNDVVEAIGGALRIALGDAGDYADFMGDGVFVLFREGTSMVVTREDAELLLRMC